MTNEELLKEIESLVCAMEESLAIIMGTISETNDPVKVFLNLLAAEDSFVKQNGQNDCRDRLLKSARKISALKARYDSNDPALQSLIANVLSGKKKSDSTH